MIKRLLAYFFGARGTSPAKTIGGDAKELIDSKANEIADCVVSNPSLSGQGEAKTGLVNSDSGALSHNEPAPERKDGAIHVRPASERTYSEFSRFTRERQIRFAVTYMKELGCNPFFDHCQMKFQNFTVNVGATQNSCAMRVTGPAPLNEITQISLLPSEISASMEQELKRWYRDWQESRKSSPYDREPDKHKTSTNRTQPTLGPIYDPFVNGPRRKRNGESEDALWTLPGHVTDLD